MLKLSIKQPNYDKIDLRLGLVCINTILRARGIFCSRSCIRRTYSVSKAKDLALQNIADIRHLLQWNEENGIKCLRLSSDMFPHFTDTECESYDIDFARPLLKEIGTLAKSLGQRLLFHPGQYNQVGAQNELVFLKTIDDLKHHADIFDAMELDDNSIIIVHGGGTYGNKDKTLLRWIEQFKLLPDNVKRRLVIENCETCYNTDDVLKIAKATGIPVVFDFHHYDCWNVQFGHGTQRGIGDLWEDIVTTWGNRRPVMHISEQADGKCLGAHSDYISELPILLFILMEKHNTSVDLEIEAKMKEQAILKLYLKYPFLQKKTHERSKPKEKMVLKLKMSFLKEKGLDQNL